MQNPSSIGNHQVLNPAKARALDAVAQAAAEELKQLRDRDLLRTLVSVKEIRGAAVRIKGRWLTSWCSNDYLGLSVHPRVIQAACDSAHVWGLGPRASRLLAGSTKLSEELEENLAHFFGAQAALVFSSGYHANLGALASLLSQKDLVLIDRFCHASLIDACRASGASVRVFRHNDASHAAALLSRYTARRRLIVTEGVFSMDGDSAPLDRLLEIAQANEALLYLDDAHGAFVVGPTGRGSPEAFGVPHSAMLYMATLGKALGCQGGFLVGPKSFVNLLHNRARTFIYTTAPAAPLLAAASEALRIVQEDPTPRSRLRQNVRRLHAALSPLKIGHNRPPTHIVPIIVGQARRACELSGLLKRRGIFAPAIRPPTVPQGTARLRLSLTALHSDSQIDALAEAMQELLSEAKLSDTDRHR